MAVYTLINKNQFESILSFYDIGQLIDYAPIKSGAINTNYLFTTTKNNYTKKYILTILEEKLTKHELEFCIDFINFLANHEIPVANTVIDRHKTRFRLLVDKYIVIIPFIQGHHLTNTNNNEKYKLTADNCAKLGKTLAKMHILGKKYPLKRLNPYGMSWCFKTFDNISDLIPIETQDIISSEFDYLSKNQSIISKQELFSGAIHADIFCDNILFYNGKLQGIIDFYNSCIDYLIYDLAIAVNDLTITNAGHILKDHYNALLSNYLSELTKDNLIYENLKTNLNYNSGLWQFMLRRASLCFWLMRLAAYYVPKNNDTENNLTNVKDPTEFEIKLLLHRNKKLEFQIP